MASIDENQNPNENKQSTPDKWAAMVLKKFFFAQ
jgi:hypothetical protein